MRVWIGFVALLCWVCLGCLGEPIPKQVRAGTTFVLPLAEVAAVPMGFGAAADAQGSELLMQPDMQRGNVRFGLCLDATCLSELPLTLRFLSRVYPDPGSPAGLRGTLVEGTRLAGMIRGQPLAVLDVPVSVPGGLYTLAAFATPPGSAEIPIPIQPIEILPGSEEHFTSITGEAVGVDVSQALRDLVPHPQVTLELIEPTGERPAAASVVVRHPRQVSIEGAFEHGAMGQGSIVRVVPGREPDTVELTLIDPDQQARGLTLAFRLTNPRAPARAEDFVIESQQLYARDGSPLPPATRGGAAGNRFAVGSIR